MTVRRRMMRKLIKLPKSPADDLGKILSAKAIADIQVMEDRLAGDLMDNKDFDPIYDVERVYSHEKDWQSRDNKIGPECFGGSDYDLDLASIDVGRLNHDGFDEAEGLMKQFKETQAKITPEYKLNVDQTVGKYTKGSLDFDPQEAWIQTYSGKRFTPIKPNAAAIVIQDIAHSLSMQCRFSGHVREFYSVAQHCVLVSHVCDSKDALWGLLHDATEAYLVDVPRPLKHSGKFGAYIECEKIMQKAICEIFLLPNEEPESVRKADTVLLATEARDLLGQLRSDWTQPTKPLPFKIEALSPREAKLLYLERFFELIGCPEGFNRYMEYEFHGAI